MPMFVMRPFQLQVLKRHWTPVFNTNCSAVPTNRLTWSRRVRTFRLQTKEHRLKFLPVVQSWDSCGLPTITQQRNRKGERPLPWRPSN